MKGGVIVHVPIAMVVNAQAETTIITKDNTPSVLPYKYVRVYIEGIFYVPFPS